MTADRTRFRSMKWRKLQYDTLCSGNSQCGFRRVGVVEDHEPAGILAEPAEHGDQAPEFLGLVPFGQIKNQRVTKLRKIRPPENLRSFFTVLFYRRFKMGLNAAGGCGFS